jgi:DNA-binding IclR family transcriptional regulator
VNLAVRDDLEMVYIEMIETDDIIRIGHNLGQRRPIYCTSVGKSILAWLPETELEKLLQKIEFHPFTPNTVRNSDQLQEELAFIRKNGYFIDQEQHVLGIRCYGAPVLNCNQEPVAALSVSVPQHKYEKNPEKEELYISVILEVMEQFSRMFSGVVNRRNISAEVS